ncbi:hypothetical protein [Actinomadura formosensis]|uniref:hypothetical protein n=1 Tax=Actinomadura formosensis TaxID=60706 RepID=UPI003D8AFABA
MIGRATPMQLTGGEVIIRHPVTGRAGRWPVAGPAVRYGGTAEIPTGRTWLCAAAEQELTISTTHRQDVVAGLRQLADWLETHPEVPVSADQTISYWVPSGTPRPDARAEVDRVAAILGVTSGPRAWPRSTTHVARRRFAGVVFEAAAYGVYPERG